MGTLTFAHGAAAIRVADRALHHLHLAINAKYRERTAFWVDVHDGIVEQRALIDPAVPIVIAYSNGDVHETNIAWVQAILTSADVEDRLVLTEEPSA